MENAYDQYTYTRSRPKDDLPSTPRVEQRSTPLLHSLRERHVAPYEHIKTYRIRPFSTIERPYPPPPRYFSVIHDTRTSMTSLDEKTHAGMLIPDDDGFIWWVCANNGPIIRRESGGRLLFIYDNDTVIHLDAEGDEIKPPKDCVPKKIRAVLDGLIRRVVETGWISERQKVRFG
ncbi:hypothetical protein ONZ45_g638 [Pleurotus djamor]|nr:hypothetical protein ONZ45_g638 [Pleurotus djamor]